MKLTKLAQSCLILEKDGVRMVIDPGSITMARHSIHDLGEVTAVLYTHRHHDHFDVDTARQLLDRGVQLYGNSDVCTLLEGIVALRHGEPVEVAGFRVQPHDIPHVPMVDGASGPPNTGFLIDDELFHPGDGMDVEQIRSRLLAAPIAGPSISFRDAYVLTERVGASVVIPIHHDFFTADPGLFARFCDVAEVVIPSPGRFVEV